MKNAFSEVKKKLIVMLLVVAMSLGLVACGNSTKAIDENQNVENDSITETEMDSVTDTEMDTNEYFETDTEMDANELSETDYETDSEANADYYGKSIKIDKNSSSFKAHSNSFNSAKESSKQKNKNADAEETDNNDDYLDVAKLPDKEKNLEEWLLVYDPDNYELNVDYFGDYFTYFDSYEYPVNWKVLWIVVKCIDADGTDEQGKKVHLYQEMDNEEIEYYKNEMSAMFAKEIESATNGYVHMDVTTLVVDEVNMLETDDNINSIVPYSFDEKMLKEFDQYNTVAITARFSSYEDDPVVFHDWAGLAYGTPYDTFGFFEVPINGPDVSDEESNFIVTEDNPWPYEPWVHEFIHTLEDFAKYGNYPICNPDEAGNYGYKDELPYSMNGYMSYYEDNLKGEVWSKKDNRMKGMTEAMWSAYAYYYDSVRAIFGGE